MSFLKNKSANDKAALVGGSLLLLSLALVFSLAPSDTKISATLSSVSPNEMSQHRPSLHWPIEVGIASVVTQSPEQSGQPYPCGSGVNSRHLLHDQAGIDKDYQYSLDIITATNPSLDYQAGEGRGVAVLAVADGIIVASNFLQNECTANFGAGNYIVIEHDQKNSDGSALLSVYLHLNSYAGVEQNTACQLNPSPSHLYEFTPPSPGESVIAGQKLAELGNTGNSTGPHLHFQLASHCILEPVNKVDCPSLPMNSIGSPGFGNIRITRNEQCTKALATGSPISPDLNPKHTPTDGSYVTALPLP